MYRSPLLVAAVAALAGCQTYEPAPVDLRAHARAFAARLQPSSPPPPAAAGAEWDLTDGIDPSEGRLLALAFHPECRLARARAGITAAVAAHAGRLPDPDLGAGLERILETVPHPWLVAADLGFTVPLSGRLGAMADLANARNATAIADVLAVERDVATNTALAFARWRAADARARRLRDLVERLRELEAIAARLAQAHEITNAGARPFSLERIQRDAELVRANADVAAAVLQLKHVTGLHPDAPVSFVAGDAPPLLTGDPAERREQLFAAPRLLRLQREHDAAERSLALAVAQQWPDLVLRPGFREEDAQPRVTLGFTLPLPLFSGAAAAIATARAERDAAAEALRCGFETMLHELATAEIRLQAATANRETVDADLVPLAEQQLDECRRLAELGQLEPLLILDAIVRDHAAKTQAIDARREVDEATIQLGSFAADSTLPTTTTDPRTGR